MEKNKNKNMQTRDKRILLVIAFVAFAGISLAIISIKAAGTSDTKTTTINATVSETMALTCDANVAIPAVIASTPQTATSNCSALTNGAAGFSLKANATTAGATASQTLVSGTTWITNTVLATYDGTSGTPAAWTGTFKGLGFRVVTTGTTNTNTLAYWGTDVSAEKFAGFPVTAQSIYNYGSYSATSSTVVIQYKLDVPTTQKAGSYTGTVLYTATTN